MRAFRPGAGCGKKDVNGFDIIFTGKVDNDRGDITQILLYCDRILYIIYGKLNIGYCRKGVGVSSGDDLL